MRKLVVAAVAFLLIAPAPALGQGFAISGHVGTTGLGGGVTIGVAPKLNLRGMFGFFPGNPEVEIEGVDWALSPPTLILATVDFYAVSGFHLSAGGLIISDGGSLGAVGTAVGRTEEFGGMNYTFTEQDELIGTFSLKSFQPYAGIGFGNGIGKTVGIMFDVGVGFGEQPTLTVTGQGPVAGTPEFQGDLQAEVQDIEDDIPEWFKFYPVIALSISIGL